MIGLADHGSVKDIGLIRSYLTERDIVVLPGFEICSSEKIHWVCLFPEDTTEEELSRLLGSLDLLDPDDGVRPSRRSGSQLLAKVREFGGLSIAAHATTDKGILRQRANHLWKDPHLDAAQIPGARDGLPQEFRQIAENTNPDYARERPLALINARDVVTPADLSDVECSCLVKMTKPSFEALRLALHDPESRIRLLSDLTEAHCGRIDSVQIDGGYLADLEVHFSPNLNALIGGRGTGKSTLLECVRYALGLEHKGAEARKSGLAILDDNIGTEYATIKLSITSSAQHGARFTIVRRYGEPSRVYDESGSLSHLLPAELLPGAEIYGQSEIFEIARDPNGIAGVLRRFVPELRTRQQEIEKLQRDLRANAGRLVALWEKQESLAADLGRLPGLTEKLQSFEKIGIAKKLAQVPLLETERQVPETVVELLDEAEHWVSELLDRFAEKWELIDGDTSTLPHAELLERAQAEINEMTLEVKGLLTKAKKTIADRRKVAGKVIGDLVKEIEKATQALEKDFSKLPDVGNQKGASVGRAYQRLQREIQLIQPLVSQQEGAAKEESKLSAARQIMLAALADARSLRAKEYAVAVKRLNRKLVGQLRLRVLANADRSELKATLSDLPGIGERSLDWMDAANEFSVPALIEACKMGSEELQRRWGLTPAKARSIASADRQALLSIEVIDLKERIDLELNISPDAEDYRPIGRLSTGQQCTAILSLLLLENPDPLIVDQPEDNLDNAFIAERIVRRLRAMKMERQFIFATHDANIPVLGDAEWIGVCTATDGRGHLPAEQQGSIDSPAIRDAAAMILDGGREAFQLRWEKYGY